MGVNSSAKLACRWGWRFTGVTQAARRGIPPAGLVITHGPVARRLDLPALAETHAAPHTLATRMLADQFDAGRFEGGHDFGQGVDISAHIAVARLHPLDRRQRNAGALRQRFLVQANERAGRAQLSRRKHEN